MTAKDWITLSISILALFISAGAAYFNILRVTDDVRVAIEGGVIVTLAKEANEFEFEGPQSLTFFNSGNRPVALSSIYLSMVQAFEREPEPKRCETWNSYIVPLKVTPFVMKPGDVQQLRAELMGTKLTLDGRGPKYTLPVNAENQKRTQDYYGLMCLNVHLATADSPTISVRVPTFIVTRSFERPEASDMAIVGTLFHPKVLLYRRKLVFWD
jgi:hypothetical protein